MPKLNAPCYKCENHAIECHSTCEKYKAYKDELNNINSRRSEEHDRNETYLGYVSRRAIGYKKTDAYKKKKKGL